MIFYKMTKVKAGQLWLDNHRKEHLFVTGTRPEDPVYSGWVYFHNIDTDDDGNSSSAWFLKNCQLVSG
jgi:hypothetical protein